MYSSFKRLTGSGAAVGQEAYARQPGMRLAVRKIPEEYFPHLRQFLGGGVFPKFCKIVLDHELDLGSQLTGSVWSTYPVCDGSGTHARYERLPSGPYKA